MTLSLVALRLAAPSAAVGNQLLCANGPWPACRLQQVRWRKRRGYAMKKLAEKRRRNIEKRKEEALKPKLTFIEKLLQARMKGKSRSLIEEHPARVLDADELEEAPASHEAPAYCASDYKATLYSVADALAKHRQLMHPTMYNFPDAPVRLRLDLNMNLQRKRRFISTQKHIVSLPHAVVAERAAARRSVVAFVAEQERQFEAVEAGADLVVGVDAVKKVVKGTLRLDDYDFVVAHTDMARFMAPLRGVMKHRFPTRVNTAMGEDITQVVRKFKTGTQYELLQDGANQQYGVCDTVVGHLAMDDAHLEENIDGLIKAVCSHRPVIAKLGHFIDRALIMLSKVPSKEFFAVDFALYAPEVPPDDDLD